MSENVTVTGIPALMLNDGGTAIYKSGSGTNLLTFTYTVGNAQNTSALAVTGTISTARPSRSGMLQAIRPIFPAPTSRSLASPSARQ